MDVTSADILPKKAGWLSRRPAISLSISPLDSPSEPDVSI